MSGKYTVNEVEDRTKVPASTLRQWERRYGFPMPARSESGYRLYSDYDIEQIEGMKRYIADGVPASRAAILVKNAKRRVASPKPANELAKGLLEALSELDDAKADRLLSEAYALHTVEKVLLEVIKPCMYDLGTMWHKGEITTTTEHFASSYVQGKLRGLFSLASSVPHSPTVVIACAPKDQHEIGALMLAVLLRRHGYRVYYIGANTPVEDLTKLAAEMNSTAIMISASTAESIEHLFEEKLSLQNTSSMLIFGGLAFDETPDLARELGGIYLDANLEEAVKRFQEMFQDQRINS